MFAALALISIPLKPLDFPETPIARHLDEGVRVYRHGKGLDRLYVDDRQVTGSWFDGKSNRGVDQAVWISPSLISRWLGYLEAKEKWPSGELERRWIRLRQDLGGKLTFVVRVCAMPKVDLLEGEIDRWSPRPDPTQVRFLWTSSPEDLPSIPPRMDFVDLVRAGSLPLNASRRVTGGMRIEPKSCLLTDLWSRQSAEVLQDDWWRRVPFGEPLRPEFEGPLAETPIPLGEFRSATFLVTVPIPEGPLAGPTFELRAFSPAKERIARFELLDRR